VTLLKEKLWLTNKGRNKGRTDLGCDASTEEGLGQSQQEKKRCATTITWCGWFQHGGKKKVTIAKSNKS